MIWRCDLKEPCVQFCESNEKDKCGIRRRDIIKQIVINIGDNYISDRYNITVIDWFSRWESDISTEHVINYIFMRTMDGDLLVRTKEEFVSEFELVVPIYNKKGNK